MRGTPGPLAKARTGIRISHQRIEIAAADLNTTPRANWTTFGVSQAESIGTGRNGSGPQRSCSSSTLCPTDVNGTDMTESQFNRPIQIQEGRSYGKPGRLVALLSILPRLLPARFHFSFWIRLAANDSHGGRRRRFPKGTLHRAVLSDHILAALLLVEPFLVLSPVVCL